MDFPALTAEEVHSRTAQFWDTSGPAPFPVGDWLACPICGFDVQIRWWKWHLRPKGHTVPHRVDVSMKCTGCAFVWFHGVALSKEAWDRRPVPKRDRRIVKWREGRKWMSST